MTFDTESSSNVRDEVIGAVGTADPETGASLIRAFQAWETIREYAAKERKRINEKLAGRLAQFKEAMEVGHASTGDQVLKLSVVEQRWQELEETREEKKLVGGSLRDQIKATEQKIKDLIEEIRTGQMNLFPVIAPNSPDDDDSD